MSLKDINTYTALNHTIIQAITWDLINISWGFDESNGKHCYLAFSQGILIFPCFQKSNMRKYQLITKCS